MSVTIDASAMLAHALGGPGQQSPLDEILADRELCLMSPAAAVEFYRGIYNAAGQAKADFWLRFILAYTDDVRLVPEDDEELVEMAADALKYRDVTPIMALTAAISRWLGAPVVTYSTLYWDLAANGFCEVRGF